MHHHSGNRTCLNMQRTRGFGVAFTTQHNWCLISGLFICGESLLRIGTCTCLIHGYNIYHHYVSYLERASWELVLVPVLYTVTIYITTMCHTWREPPENWYWYLSLYTVTIYITTMCHIWREPPENWYLYLSYTRLQYISPLCVIHGESLLRIGTSTCPNTRLHYISHITPYYFEAPNGGWWGRGCPPLLEENFDH